MKFTVPLIYKAEFKRKGRRNVESVRLMTDVEIDLLEVERPERPAFEVMQPPVVRGRTGWQRFRSFGERPGRVWRLDDGRLYAEFCSVEDFVEEAQDDDSPFNAWGGSSVTAALLGGSHEFSDVSTYEKVNANDDLREWIDDGGANRFEVVQRRASAMRVIDGMVCAPVGEPVLRVSKGAKDEYEVFVEEHGEFQCDGFWCTAEHNQGRRFRGDGLDDARAMARSLNASGAVQDHGVRIVSYEDEVLTPWRQDRVLRGRGPVPAAGGGASQGRGQGDL